ncbi:MAG: DMT family transporter, partial [SAR116 cluster bacterium]|nr:DMT family transporter [SAR116 cluster bacterium]
MTFGGLNPAALLALAAALSWTMAALFSHRPATELGSLHFNRLRMIAVVIIITGMLLATGRSMAIGGEFWPYIILSSLTGIVFGDFLLFAAMRRVGPRRTNVLFATNALFAAVFGWVFLGESLGGQTFLAILFGFCGVVLAVIYGKRRDLMHQWEAVTPPLWIGVMLGLSAAVCQALGVIFIRPAMAAGVDPVAATLARAVVGAVVFWMTWPFDERRRDKPLIPDRSLLLLIALNGLFG